LITTWWNSSRLVSITSVIISSSSRSYGWVSAIWLFEEIISLVGSSVYACVSSISTSVVVVVVWIVILLLSSSIILFVCDDEIISSWSSLFNCVDSITNGTVAGNVDEPITKFPSSSFDIDVEDGMNDEDSFKPFCFGGTSSESNQRKRVR
jgi:hypothetical protein